MLALLTLLAAVSPEPLPAPSTSPLPRAVRVVEVRLSSLESTLRAEAAAPSRLHDLARALVERARTRLAAGDADAADQLGAAAVDTLRAERPFIAIIRLPEGAQPPRPPGPATLPRPPAGVSLPRPPVGVSPFDFDVPPMPPSRIGSAGAGRTTRASDADRAARQLDRTATMLVMTAGFAERGDAATLLGLARTALDTARKALAANDARSAETGARRAETLARAALHAAIADDRELRVPLPPMPPLPMPHRPPAIAPVPPGDLP